MMNFKPKDVDEYLAAVPDERRTALEELRATIKAAVPETVEMISYGIPNFKYQGRPLVAIGDAKKHYALYVMSTAVIDDYRDELASYGTGGGTVRFTLGNPVPAGLVKKLVKARVGEIEAQAKEKAAARKR